jgi:hypothetical protein
MVTYDGKPTTQAEVRRALEYQLRERMSLVEAPDSVVADLLAALGNVLVLDGARAHAAAVYGLSLGYEPAQAKLVEMRRAVLSPISQSTWERATQGPVMWGVLACLVVIILYVGKRRGAPRKRAIESSH